MVFPENQFHVLTIFSESVRLKLTSDSPLGPPHIQPASVVGASLSSTPFSPSPLTGRCFLRPLLRTPCSSLTPIQPTSVASAIHRSDAQLRLHHCSAHKTSTDSSCYPARSKLWSSGFRALTTQPHLQRLIRASPVPSGPGAAGRNQGPPLHIYAPLSLWMLLPSVP